MKSEKFYDKISILYPLVDIFLRPQKKILLKELNELPDGRVLEIGVGNGSHLSLYEKHQIIGIDTSASMLKSAEKRKPSRVDLLQMNGESLLFPENSFDYVVLSHVIAVAENPDKLLEEVYRVLKPEGSMYILNHFTPDNWLRYVDYIFGFFSKWLHFRSVFHIQDIKTIENFCLIKETSCSPCSYFKLLVFSKK